MVKESIDKYSLSPDEAFILGMLHDIGYEFCEIKKDHAHKDGELLKEQGYKFWREVYFHGMNQEEYLSPEIRLLNYVDMTTSHNGEYVSMRARIEIRYGKESLEVENARKLKKLLECNYK